MEDEARLREIEKRLNAVENQQALFENNAEHAKDRYSTLEKRIDVIQAGVNRLIWTGGGLILVAIGNFIIKGGLVHAGV